MWIYSDPMNLHGDEGIACFNYQILFAANPSLQEKTEWVREVFGDDGDWELHLTMTNLPVTENR